IELLAASSRTAVLDALQALSAGGRSEPLEILADCGDGRVRRAMFRAFMLPELAPAVSCAMIYEGAAFDISVAPSQISDANGFMDLARDGLRGKTGAALQRLAMAFIEVQGLNAAN